MAAELGHFPNRFYVDFNGAVHLNGAPVYDSNERDISGMLSSQNSGTVFNSTSGTISAALGNALISSGTTGSYQITPPVAGAQSAGGDDLKKLQINSSSANAHTFTAGSNILNGNKATATLAAAVGNGMELQAYNGVWLVIRNTGVTLA